MLSGIRVALCVSGNQRQSAPKLDVINKIMVDLFEPMGVDIYYQTFDDKPPLLDPGNLLITKDPLVNYHPIYDPSLDWIDPNPRLLWQRSSTKIHPKWRKTAKQLIAHADIIDNLPHDYDIIIRTRWDAVFSPMVNWREWITEAHSSGRPIGFQGPYQSNLDNLDHSPYDLAPDGRGRRNHLMDHAIIHTKDVYDTDRVRQLYRDKQLFGGEWGWYQIMSAPFSDHHRCLWGGIQINRMGWGDDRIGATTE